jgi:hypothetical protein
MCTKASSLPSSGLMKPKPISALNHFTFPIGMRCSLPQVPGHAPGKMLMTAMAKPEGLHPSCGETFVKRLLKSRSPQVARQEGCCDGTSQTDKPASTEGEGPRAKPRGTPELIERDPEKHGSEKSAAKADARI